MKVANGTHPASGNSQRARLPFPAPGEKYWVCELTFFDFDCAKPCPRCSKPCQWLARTTIYSRGQIAQGTIHWPLCSCPTEHIEKAIASALAEALVNDIREHPEHYPELAGLL